MSDDNMEWQILTVQVYRQFAIASVYLSIDIRLHCAAVAALASWCSRNIMKQRSTKRNETKQRLIGMRTKSYTPRMRKSAMKKKSAKRKACTRLAANWKQNLFAFKYFFFRSALISASEHISDFFRLESSCSSALFSLSLYSLFALFFPDFFFFSLSF